VYVAQKKYLKLKKQQAHLQQVILTSTSPQGAAALCAALSACEEGTSEKGLRKFYLNATTSI
jgi:hypothetical protein